MAPYALTHLVEISITLKRDSRGLAVVVILLLLFQLPCPNGALLLDDDVPESPPAAHGRGAQGTAGRARQGQQGHGGVKS